MRSRNWFVTTITTTLSNNYSYLAFARTIISMSQRWHNAPKSKSGAKVQKNLRMCKFWVEKVLRVWKVLRIMGCMGIYLLLFSFFSPMLGVFMGYSRSIRGVFTGYSYVSVMYRLCVGYVSVIYRNRHGGRGIRQLRWKTIEAPARCAHEILINLFTMRLVANYTTKIVVYYRKLTKIIRD